MEHKDGGHAFPTQAWENDGDRVLQYQRSGMTLRDYFAASAAQGMYAAFKRWPSDGDHYEVAVNAYKAADAMLAAREPKEPA